MTLFDAIKGKEIHNLEKDEELPIWCSLVTTHKIFSDINITNLVWIKTHTKKQYGELLEKQLINNTAQLTIVFKAYGSQVKARMERLWLLVQM